MVSKSRTTIVRVGNQMLALKKIPNENDFSNQTLKKAASGISEINAEQETTSDTAMRSVSSDISLDEVYNIRNGEINYEKRKNIAGRIQNGELGFGNLNAQESEGTIRGGQRNVETSIILTAKARANQKASRGRGQGLEARKKRQTNIENLT